MCVRKMNSFLVIASILCFQFVVGFSATIDVDSIADLQKAINNAKPGDQVILADGVYKLSENITINNQGTESQPIVISPKTIGGAKIEGTGGFVIVSPAKYVILKGFVFTHNTGITSVGAGATHCTITRNVFECVPLYAGNKSYLVVNGDDNEVSYNTFQNKKDEGQMLSIQGPGRDHMAKRTWVHHNYFFNFPPPGKNNCSAIQIGLSWRSMDSAFSIIEHNLFIKTRGENEGIICHKSCNNIIRFNTFGEGCQEVSIRHGNKSQVYGNFFLGGTGLRFSGDDHVIYSNYFQGCRNAIVCTNGDGEVAAGDKLTCHDRADRVKVVYNTLIDCRNNFLMPGRKNGMGATHITFANNIIQGGSPVTLDSLFLNPVWEGNILWNTTSGTIPESGFVITDPKLEAGVDGILRPSKGSPAIGAGTGLYTFVNIDVDGQARDKKLDTGADQFAKVPSTNRPLSVADVGPDAK